MHCIYSDDHRLQHGMSELSDGLLQESFERPERADNVLSAFRASGLGEVIAPNEYGPEPIQRIHNDSYLSFLRSAWELWAAEGRDCDALPLNWAVRGMRQIEPDTIDGKLSYFSFDAGTPITTGTWQAATSAANVALTGAQHLNEGASAAFSLCRPPGHHATTDVYGGYCFLNNAAIACQYLLDHGAARIALIDVDYHHGNGSQSIFYARDDVLFLSIHADPKQEYPFFLGHADERGEGAGDGYNCNFPLPWKTAAGPWFEALDECCRKAAGFKPDAIVVSLGVDTYKKDPISQFGLDDDDYRVIGERLATLGLPTLFVLEGGYALAEIGANVVNVLAGWGQFTQSH